MSTVLLVDDNEADLQIISRAFHEVGDFDVVAMQSAAAAIEWLGDGPSQDLLVVTDLNMPGLDGIALIQRLHEIFDAPPVTLVMSTSGRAVDIKRAYAAGANGYHTKPMGYHETATLCEQIANYWFTAADRPGLS